MKETNTTDSMHYQKWDEATRAAGEYDPEIKNTIKSAIDLASLIGETCKPDGDSGVRFDHGHKHTSNQGNCVSITTNSKGEPAWHCFECEADGDSISGGDCFAWIADRDNLDMITDFPEIVRIAADYAGIVLPTTKEDEDKTRVFACLTEAARAYHDNLTEEMYDDIKETWGITRETCNTMLIGSCKTDGSEKEVLRKAGFSFDEMLSTGLFSGVTNAIPSYKGRYTFPYWVRGRVEYMDGRSTERTPGWKGKTPPKHYKLRTNKGEKKNEYISIHIKNIIFGTDSLNTNKDFCLITEGIADAIMAIQEGFPCMSPVTTKFNHADHPRILKLVRKFKKVYVCMDSERSGAGLAGAYATAKHLIDNGIDAYIVELPRPEGVDKIDLADYLRDHDAKSFEQLMVVAKPPPLDALPPADQFLRGDNDVFSANEFAKWLVLESGLSFVTLNDTKDILQYDDGVYVAGGDDEIGRLVELIMDGYKVTTNAVSEIIGHVRRRTGREREGFDNDDNIINLYNGLYDRQEGTLLPHTPEYLSLHKSAIIYDPSATCPRIDRFLDEVLLGKDVELMQELFGYALLPKKRLDTAVIFEGTGSNGKSRMIDLFDAFVGHENTAHITPNEIGEDKYATSDLVGKLLNTVPDMGNSPLRQLGKFKSIVSGESVRAQQKNKPAFHLNPTALCIFGCNDVPITTDTSDGFFRRMVVVSFLRTFDVGADDTDTELKHKITTPSELSGLFNRAMIAVKILIENERFTGAGTIEDRRQRYVYASTPIARFVDELCYTTNPDAFITKDELYNQYVTWSKDNKLRVKQKKDMTIYLGEIGCQASRMSVIDDDGERPRIYMGIDMIANR
jgi:P4 family phage/plasmid primase-like protien